MMSWYKLAYKIYILYILMCEVCDKWKNKQKQHSIGIKLKVLPHVANVQNKSNKSKERLRSDQLKTNSVNRKIQIWLTCRFPHKEDHLHRRRPSGRCAAWRVKVVSVSWGWGDTAHHSLFYQKHRANVLLV